MEVKIRHKKFLNIVCYYFCFRWIDRQFCQLQSKTWLDWVYQKEGTFCAPANLEKQKAALVDKISNVGRERIAKRSRHSKSVSVGWMHYDSVKKKHVGVTEAKGGGVRQCIFQNETPEEEILLKAKDIFFSNKRTLYGTEDDLTFSLGNFKGEVIDDTLFTLQNYITSNKLSKTRLYLMSDNKLEQTHQKNRSQMMTTESDFDEDFDDIFPPIIPSDFSSSMASTSSNLLLPISVNESNDQYLLSLSPTIRPHRVNYQQETKSNLLEGTDNRPTLLNENQIHDQQLVRQIDSFSSALEINVKDEISRHTHNQISH